MVSKYMFNIYLVNGEGSDLLKILERVENIAQELAFNLEFGCLSEVLDDQQVSEAEFKRYFDLLSLYLDRSFYLELPSELVLRIKAAHKFTCDSFSQGKSELRLLTDNYNLWIGQPVKKIIA